VDGVEERNESHPTVVPRIFLGTAYGVGVRHFMPAA
jgi:hypothetical protein